MSHPVEPEDHDTPEEAEAETPAEEERTAAVLRLSPVQDAPYTGHRMLKVKRSPGRPRKVERMPTVNDLDYHAEMAKEKAQYIASDPIVLAVEENKPPAEVLKEVKRAVARETAAMGFDRLEHEKRGRTTESSAVSVRRIDALKKIAEIELKLREMAAESGLDVTSPKFKKIVAFFVEKVREVAMETLTPEVLDMFFNKFATSMEKWEEEVSNLIH